MRKRSDDVDAKAEKARGQGGGRPARVKAAKKGPKAKGAKPVAAKPAAPPVPVAVPKPGVEKTKEKRMVEPKSTPDQFLAEILTPEHTRETGHICWDCKHFKPVLKGSKFPPADTIGWCVQIHWPFFWCVTDFNVVKKCYAFEKGIYAPYQPARFE